MQHLLRAVRTAAAARNSYAALTLALTLPDICASLAASDGKSCSARYIGWVEANLTPVYTHTFRGLPEPHVFLSGGDCYALRCAVLHQGLDDVTGHRSRVALERFRLVQPTEPGTVYHRNQAGAVLNLQVDIFCEDMCRAVEAWLLAEESNPDIARRIAALMTIDDLSTGFPI